MRLRARSKTVSSAVPWRTRTPQLEPRWSWMGLRWPFRQQRTSAWYAGPVCRRLRREAAGAGGVVDGPPLAVPPAEDERLVRRPGVQEVAAVAVAVELHERPHVVERDPDFRQGAFQLGKRDALAPGVELLEDPAERGRHEPHRES